MTSGGDEVRSVVCRLPRSVAAADGGSLSRAVVAAKRLLVSVDIKEGAELPTYVGDLAKPATST
jgi:hypothetical protein